MSRVSEKDEQEEALAIGRLLGKADKDLLKAIDQLAKQKKTKKSEIIKEALEYYQMFQLFEGLDGKTLFAGFMFWRNLMDMAINDLAKLAPIYSSTLVQTQMQTIAQVLETANKLREQQTQQSSAPATEEPTKSIIDNVRATLLQKVVELLTNTLTNMTLSPTAQTQNQSQLSSSAQTQNVPIEILNEGEAEENK